MPYTDIISRVGEKAFLDALLDTTEAIVVVTNSAGRIAMVNAAFEEHLGYSAKEAEGRPVWAFRALDEIAAGRRRFAETSGEARILRNEPKLWRKADGGHLLLAWSVRILRDEEGREVARVATARDLTETRLAEERASAADRRRKILEHLANNLTEPLFFIDPDGDIAYASQAVSRVYGYEPDELIGRPASILRPTDRADHMAAHLDRLKRSGKPETLETEALHRDGHRIRVELRSSPVHDDDGTYLGLAAVVYDMKERYELEEELRRLAGTDQLTGVANRLGFLAVAEHEVKRARRYGHPLSVVVADIDHFKKVNDTFGHAAGDEALVRFTDVMGWSLRRPIDHLSRTGGEEFLAILPQTDGEGAVTAAERIRSSVENNPFKYMDKVFYMTVSLGVSSWSPDEEDLAPAVKRADRALYRAKEGGRNRVEWIPPDGAASDLAAS